MLIQGVDESGDSMLYTVGRGIVEDFPLFQAEELRKLVKREISIEADISKRDNILEAWKQF